jgi:peptidoglycan/LPS O-acetylase OafA/YrhL
VTELLRNRNIDLLRVAAISMVLIYHGFQQSPVRPDWIIAITDFGQYGVDLFFVLSGWLIGGLYWRERQGFGNVMLVRFWIRRWLRTVPPYLAALAASWLAVHYARGQRFDFGYLFFIQNYYGRLPFFSASWSLCIEEQFYLLGPVICTLWPERVPRRVVAPLLILMLFAPAIARLLAAHAPGPEFGYPLTATHLRMEGLFLGFLLAYLSRYAAPLFGTCQKLAPYLLVASLGAIVLLQFAGVWLRYALCGLAVAVCFASLLLMVGPARQIRLSGVMTPIAVGSYSLYLTHGLAIQIARRLVMGWPEAVGLLYFPIMIVLVSVLGLLFFNIIERTSIRVRDSYWPRRTEPSDSSASAPIGLAIQ